MTKYRIVTDNYLGYEVQQWSWYWPFWIQTNHTNTHATEEVAEQWIRLYVRQGTVVRKLGTLK